VDYECKTVKQPEEANTHKIALTHAGNVFVTRDLDLLTRGVISISDWGSSQTAL